VLFEMFSGNDLDLNVGPMTLTDIVFTADRTRSGSNKIFGRFGAIVAKIVTISSALVVVRGDVEPFSGGLSRNPIGLVVKIAVRSRRKRSC